MNEIIALLESKVYQGELISKEEALKIAACFGGGMWHGDRS